MTDDTTHRVGIYGWTHTHGTSGVDHYRIVEPLRVARDRGINAFTGRTLSNEILEQVDHVLVHQIHDEAGTKALAELESAGGHKIIYDVDDWMWEPDYLPFRNSYGPAALARLYDNVRRAHVVTTPSPAIATHLATYNPNVWLVPNTVPEWVTKHQMPARERPAVGWQLSTSHLPDFTPAIGRQLALFLRDNPLWVLHGYGHVAPLADDRGGRLRQFPWANNVQLMYTDIAMDIGIGPLRNTAFNRAKSSLRAVEYAALGIVAVLPDMEPYRGWVLPGETGILLPTDRAQRHTALRDALDYLASAADVRDKMSRRARELAASNFTTENAIGAWIEAWASQPSS